MKNRSFFIFVVVVKVICITEELLSLCESRLFSRTNSQMLVDGIHMCSEGRRGKF